MDRASTQADPEIAKLIRERFVLVAGDRWYHARRNDAIGSFMEKLDEQANPFRRGKRVQQGLYCFRADGLLLTHQNSDHERNLRSIKRALTEWEKLPAETRKPGAIRIEDCGRLDLRYDRSVPDGALVLNVFMRVLDQKDGELCVGDSTVAGGALAARDKMWITKREWQSLIPKTPHRGQVVAIPEPLRRRIIRFHLCDHTRGHANAWKEEHIRSSRMFATVSNVSEAQLQITLEGDALLASSSLPVDKAPIGYDVAFRGRVEVDRNRRRIARFDFVAVGDHWGDGRFNRGARPGRSLLGIAYELCPASDVSQYVPPVGMTNPRLYLGRDY